MRATPPNAMNRVMLNDCAPQPWRNGGGQTRELLAWPDAKAWHLRLSVASIDRDGPFSAFAGVQRRFAVLAGAGVELQWPARCCSLHVADEPVGFDGADAPLCRLINGPTVDLNLMWQAGAGHGSLERAQEGEQRVNEHGLLAIYSAQAATVQIDGQAEALPANCLLWTTHDRPMQGSLLQGSQAYWIRWQPGSAAS
jgi:uncharacterized protein